MNLPRILIAILLVALAGLGYWYFSSNSDTQQANNLKTTVKRGEFKIYVNATGELQAKRSVKIRGPQGMRSAQIYQTNITDLVPEGTVVTKGEYVASLDRTELATKMKEAQTEIDKIMTQLEQVKIDTAIELRGIRDQLINLKFSMEEKRLQVEQSQFEPQSIIRQAEIELEKADRDFSQLEKKYELTQTKSEAQINEILTNLRQNQANLDRLNSLAQEFTITAPEDGMVIYARSWNGKIGPGSQISTWDPVVAELPDMSDMVTKTYVNEVDISKVKKGQDVKIKVDAFPDESYTGHVIQVANIGEQLRGYDAKVFEVIVQVHESDTILRPSMTTSNQILTYTFPDVLYIPLEALQSDSLTYVYKSKDGRTVKQEVITGEINDNEVIIAHGLEEGEEVFLSTPSGADKLEIIYLPTELKQQIANQLAEERRQRQQEANAKAAAIKDEKIQTEMDGSSGIIIIN